MIFCDHCAKQNVAKPAAPSLDVRRATENLEMAWIPTDGAISKGILQNLPGSERTAPDTSRCNRFLFQTPSSGLGGELPPSQAFAQWLVRYHRQRFVGPCGTARMSQYTDAAYISIAVDDFRQVTNDAFTLCGACTVRTSKADTTWRQDGTGQVLLLNVSEIWQPILECEYKSFK